MDYKEKVIALLNSQELSKEQKEQLENIFPELKESEDEKMRKMCIRYLDWEYQHCYCNEDKTKIEKCIAWLEKQGKQKPDDNKPKFKVGDCVISNDGTHIYIVKERKRGAYVMLDIDDDEEYSIIIESADRTARFWTIQDAKDGDVLCTYECDEPKTAFILKGTPKKHYALSYYCYYNIMYPHFDSDSEEGCLAPKDENVQPATKEQRDLLFQKMKEAGYEWDSDKKVLKKIEVVCKESEDEKIRKGLINGFKECLEDCQYPKNAVKYWHNAEVDNILTWLEKQGNVDKASYEIAEKEKYDFVSGQFIECRKSFNEFKEDNSYWFEYVGNDTYIGRSDNILNQKFHITPRQLYCLFTQQHCPKENNVNEETNVPTGYGKYVDECLYEAAEHFFSEGEDKYSVADLFYAGVRCGKSCLEKQDEKDPCIGCTNDKGCVTCEDGNMKETKAGPKFHPGDWIVDNAGNIFQIERAFETIAKDIFGYITVGGVYFNDNNDVRIWTIQDAKDGDVLLEGEIGEPFIYNGNRAISFSGYFLGAHCGIYNGEFNPYGNVHYWGKNSCPATKEQRNLLFQKMADAGYEWDADKKKLKKIEVRASKESEDERIKREILELVSISGIDYNQYEEIKDWLEKQGEKKSVDEVLKIRRELYQSGYNDGYKHGQEDIAKSLEKKSGDEELKGITQWMPMSEPPKKGGEK